MTDTMRHRREGFWLLPLALLMALAGCGPGVGGTGTGEGFGLDFFGAKRASVCTASFAGELRCPSRIVIGPTRIEPAAGSEPVVWIDDPASGRYAASINLSDIELNDYCEGIRFVGTWGTTEEGSSSFFGHYTAPWLDVAVLGKLSVQSGEGAGLTYVLSDAAGQTVLGPVVLQRAEAAPVVAYCPKVLSSPLPKGAYR